MPKLDRREATTQSHALAIARYMITGKRGSGRPRNKDTLSGAFAVVAFVDSADVRLTVFLLPFGFEQIGEGFDYVGDRFL